VAAYLSKGVDPEKMGEEIDDYVKFASPKPKPANENTLRGVVLKVDRFGNLVTNITPQDAPMLFDEVPPPFKILVGKKEVTAMHSIYADARPGELFGILGSMGYLEIAANRGSAHQLIGSGKGTEVNVILEGAAAAGTGN
jgi:S-adenosylmethionine hydrolase